MILLLTLTGGLCRVFAYVEMIRLGNRDKTYCMPLFALGLNFAWDTVYSVEGIRDIQMQTIFYIGCLILDAAVMYTYFKYGRERFPEQLRKKFIPLSIAVFIICFGLQSAFYCQFDIRPAAQYSGFLQNVLTSLLFIHMFYTRSDTRGQSLSIAAAKGLGTLASVVLQGYVEMTNPYILICGAISLAADIYYIVLIAGARRRKAS